jgi:protein KRI1
MGAYDDEAEADDGWVEPTRWEADGDDDDDEGPINMDADYIGLAPAPKKKKLSKADKKALKADKRAAEAAASNAALSFEERTSKLKAAATELNALQGEDMIGDLRTRFKYTKSAPASFGLTPADILMATDAELNEIVSVKHLAPYRRGLGIAGRGLGGRVRALKSRVAQRKWGDEMPVENKRGVPTKREGPGGANALPLGERKKRLGKNERKKRAQDGEGEGEGAEEVEATAPAAGKRKRDDEAAPAAAAPAAAGGESGEGKKKRRKKKKAGAEA